MNSKTVKAVRLLKNVAASSESPDLKIVNLLYLHSMATYWYFKEFNCNRNAKNAHLCTELSTWLVSSAVVIYLSPHEMIPQAFGQCVQIRSLYNVVAALIYSHIILCYIWVELVAALLKTFDFLDEKAKNIGLGMLTDNFLYTLNRHDGYINVFTFMAWLMFIASLRSWLKIFIPKRTTSQADRRSVCSDESSDSDVLQPRKHPDLRTAVKIA